MTKAEQVCRLLIIKGKWTRVNCYLCRKINQEKCRVLKGMTTAPDTGGEKNDA